LEPVFRAWQEGRPRCAELPGHAKLTGGLSLHDFHPVIQTQFLGVKFTETCDWSPAWNEAASSPCRPTPHHPPRAAPPPLPSSPKKLFVTPPRGIGKGPSALSTPLATVQWCAYSDAPSPSSSSRVTSPRGILSKARGGGRRGASRWSPEKPKQVHWGTGTTRILARVGEEKVREEPTRQPAELTAPPRGIPTHPWPGQPGAQDAVTVLQKLTSFMALRDPDLLAAAASEVGEESLMGSLIPHLHGWDQHRVGRIQPPHRDQPAASTASTTEKLRRHEEELANLLIQAETTRKLILEARS
jgi:hypothetical protein